MAGVSKIRLDDGDLVVHVDDLSRLVTLGSVDVEVTDSKLHRWGATFFTLEGIEALFQKNTVTGECAAGLYFWASDMILVRSLSIETLTRVIHDLRKSREFSDAFTRFD